MTKLTKYQRTAKKCYEQLQNYGESCLLFLLIQAIKFLYRTRQTRDICPTSTHIDQSSSYFNFLRHRIPQLREMAAPSQTRQWVLRNKPYELPVLCGDNPTFELVNNELPIISDNQLLVKPVYFSNDPAQRTWIAADADPERSYAPPVTLGEPMAALGLGEVLESRSSSYTPGALVYGRMSWSEYVIIDQKDIYPIPLSTPRLSVTHFMGSLGLAGITAYCGLTDVVKATQDDSIVISGAAGAVGTMAVQIASKLIGCKKVIPFNSEMGGFERHRLSFVVQPQLMLEAGHRLSWNRREVSTR